MLYFAVRDLLSCHENVGRIFLWKVCKFSPSHTAFYSGRHKSSWSLPL